MGESPAAGASSAGHLALLCDPSASASFTAIMRLAGRRGSIAVVAVSTAGIGCGSSDGSSSPPPPERLRTHPRQWNGCDWWVHKNLHRAVCDSRVPSSAHGVWRVLNIKSSMRHHQVIKSSMSHQHQVINEARCGVGAQGLSWCDQAQVFCARRSAMRACARDRTHTPRQASHSTQPTDHQSAAKLCGRLSTHSAHRWGLKQQAVSGIGRAGVQGPVVCTVLPVWA